MLEPLDRAIINRLQGEFPLCEEPYAQVAEELGTSEAELIARLQRLLDDKILSRFGPMYHAERLGGGLTLAALAVPEERFEAVAAQVNAFAEVAHNYQRDHHLNMWFVLATETPQRINEVIGEIERLTGLTVFNMPKEQEFYIGLRFDA
ncbi:MAG: AsnC family transcriptional regulator [Gammaproteobacteria bacterium]|nr:AsnC family transcriptional regulator [Gammaproteobacteria bacterium]